MAEAAVDPNHYLKIGVKQSPFEPNPYTLPTVACEFALFFSGEEVIFTQKMIARKIHEPLFAWHDKPLAWDDVVGSVLLGEPQAYLLNSARSYLKAPGSPIVSA